MKIQRSFNKVAPSTSPFLKRGHRRIRWRGAGFLFLTLMLWTFPLFAQGTWSGSIGIESRGFPHAPLDADQSRADASVVFAPEYDVFFDDGNQGILFEGFVRLDGVDGRRTHWDIRELFWERVADLWEIRAGVRRVFWGVTESQHLVDVVNQTDLVERPDGEAKLGQPMVNVTLVNGWGGLDLFVLPYFRERTFPGQDGRLRPPLFVTDDARYVDGDVKRHVSFAARWSHTLGMFDVGLSHFWGTVRDPELTLWVESDDTPVLKPFYERVHQTGLELQTITGGWLWKLEGIHRSGQGDRFTALTGGFEYTVGNIKNSGVDVGLLAEYLWDERDALSPFEDDFFVGTRVALNDVQNTSVLAGAFVDRTSGSSAFLFEASRRVGDRWTVGLEGRGFWNAGVSDPLYAFRKDSHGEIKITHHF
jgi:hypothetical protein